MKKTASKFIALFLISCLIYFCTVVLIYYFSVFQGNKGVNFSLFGGGDDGQFYYQQALNIYRGLPYINTSIHVFIFGWILKIFNTEEVMLLRGYNYLGMVFLIMVSLMLLKKILNSKSEFYNVASILIIILMLYPSLILNTTLSLYRDIWIFFFFLWSIYLFTTIFIEKGTYPKVINAAFFIFSIIMLFGYRKYALLSFLIGSIIYLILYNNKKRKANLSKAMLYLFIGFSTFYVFLKDFNIPLINLSLGKVLDYRKSFIEEYAGGSQMNISLDQPNIVLFYLNYLYSLASNVLGPFPWQVSGVSTLVLMVTEGIAFSFILIVLYKNRKGFNSIDRYLLIQSIVWFMLISISNDNFGAASRLRIVGWLPLMILFAKTYGESKFLKKRIHSKSSLESKN